MAVQTGTPKKTNKLSNKRVLFKTKYFQWETKIIEWRAQYYTFYTLELKKKEDEEYYEEIIIRTFNTLEETVKELAHFNDEHYKQDPEDAEKDWSN